MSQPVPIRMSMPGQDARVLSAWLAGRADGDHTLRVRDQLWLRAVLLEQRRRTDTDERWMFDRRADRLLETLDHEQAFA